MGLWYVVDLFEEENFIPFDTWMRRGANEFDRMIWCGIVKCISKNGIFRQFVMISHCVPMDSLVA